ncbi:MAG: ATPase domain-containing protein [Candidatus Thermoplasmatota archaeon]|nr:ATPase domain-containing protein [Candidatus Thermoplasmatota archaeon]
MDELGMGMKLEAEDSRVSTGIDGLDGLLNGGFPSGSITLVSGTPGTGKTIVCFQYIEAGIKNGENCLYLTSDEPAPNLINEAKKLGFDFQSAVDNEQLKFIYLDVDKNNIHKEMDEEIQTGKYDRVVMDSLSPLTETPVWMVNNGNEVIPSSNSMTTTTFPIESAQATRLHLRHLMNILKEDKCTSMVTTEIPEGSRDLSRDSISEFLVDGILVLDLDTTMDRRKLTIRKMRGTKHTLKPHNIEIGKRGISLL